VDQDADGQVPQIWVLVLSIIAWVVLYLLLFLPTEDEEKENQAFEEAEQAQDALSDAAAGK